MDEDWDDFTTAPIVPAIVQADYNLANENVINDDEWNGFETSSSTSVAAPELEQVSIEDEVEPVVDSTSIVNNSAATANDDDGWNGFEISNSTLVTPSVAQVSIEDAVEPVD